jgi:hypothetical protein
MSSASPGTSGIVARDGGEYDGNQDVYVMLAAESVTMGPVAGRVTIAGD